MVWYGSGNIIRIRSPGLLGVSWEKAEKRLYLSLSSDSARIALRKSLIKKII